MACSSLKLNKQHGKKSVYSVEQKFTSECNEDDSDDHLSTVESVSALH